MVMSSRSRYQRFRDWYVSFVENRGFAVVVTVCVAVIASTAVWTKQQPAPYVAPTPPAAEDQSVARLLQESLRDVATPSPAPTAAPLEWQPPLDSMAVLTAFDDCSMLRSGVSGIWTLHDAVDLSASPGDPVYAMADGTITDFGESAQRGAWVTVEHADGYTAAYSGLAMLGAIKQGDTVKGGQCIGFVGGIIIEESDLDGHIHLRMTHQGKAIDPIPLIQ